jgi:hypothetical protein
MEINNLKVAKEDKGKTIVIIHRDVLRQKLNTCIQNNNTMQLNKDLTEQYQKQISPALQKCDPLTSKNQHVGANT